jgi:hypothetical protein
LSWWSKATRPKSHRRLTHATLVAVFAAALAMLVACGNSSRAHAAQKTSTQHAAFKRRLSGGMTKKQVVRVLGRPKTIRGNYWYWPVVDGKLAGKTLVTFGNNNQPFVFRAPDQFRILFFYGVLQNEQARWRPPHHNFKWIPVNI